MSSVVVVLASSVLLTVQNVVLTGALSGRVTDQSGAVMTGASVVVQNLGTSVNNLPRQTIPDFTGFWHSRRDPIPSQWRYN
jgi:hypothetical protein